MAAHRKVKVGWKAKVIAFTVFDKMPLGELMYFFFQKNLTKTYPRALAPTARSGDMQITHAKKLISIRPDLGSLTLMEFGAGWDLYTNLIYYCYGINHQVAVDVRRWARAELVNAVIEHLQDDPPPDAVRLPQIPVRDDSLEEDLLAHYGIRYLAPFDASKTGFEPATIDVITTTSVFEHIPKAVSAAILDECRRVIRSDGVMRHTIDYSDHYAHADPAITSYNMLRFSAGTWRFLNPGIHYQNRLRTPDFLELFASSGFEVVEFDEWPGHPREFRETKVHAQFDGYDRSALMTLGATFLLKPV